jgi:hypothetical protein
MSVASNPMMTSAVAGFEYGCSDHCSTQASKFAPNNKNGTIGTSKIKLMTIIGRMKGFMQ